MDPLRPIEPFGQIRMPLLSRGELTANYRASDWARLSESWKITMYWTLPESGEPVEMPSVTLDLRTEDFQVCQELTPDAA